MIGSSFSCAMKLAYSSNTRHSIGACFLAAAVESSGHLKVCQLVALLTGCWANSVLCSAALLFLTVRRNSIIHRWMHDAECLSWVSSFPIYIDLQHFSPRTRENQPCRRRMWFWQHDVKAGCWSTSELSCEAIMPAVPRVKTLKACHAHRVATNASPKNRQTYAAAADP